MTKFLDIFKSKFDPDVFEGGCETCGYGATGGMSKENYIKLLQEMDKWIKDTFEEKN